jgi:hypothetical protein
MFFCPLHGLEADSTFLTLISGINFMKEARRSLEIRKPEFPLAPM